MKACVSTDGEITLAEMGHSWRDGTGLIHATVRLGGAILTFDDPGAARAVSAACLKAADALDALAAEGGTP